MNLSPVTRRLLPLYIGSFLQGIVFWYAIEKLFMTSIGFTATTIGLMVSMYSVVVLLAETPSGILADRWSRKGVLILASVALAVSSLLAGLSYELLPFLIAMMFWGLYAALSSGTYDSVIYDTLQEAQGNSKQYKLYYGRHEIVAGLSLVVGALAGGLIASQVGMREAFFYTIPFSVLSIVVLWSFKEPKLHKAEVSGPIKAHVAQTFRAVLRNKSLVPLLISLVAFTVIGDMLFEFSQVWFITSLLPVIFFGPAYALVLSSVSFSGYLAKFADYAHMQLVMSLAVITSTLLLIFVQNPYLLIAAEFVLCVAIFIFTIQLTHDLHDSLPSKVRAGSSSAISTIARLIIIPFALLFGFASEQLTIYTATWMLLVVAVIGIISLRTAASPHR